MNKEFALDPGGPKRLKITYAWNLANAQVDFDGQRIMSFATKAEFRRGNTVKLADGSLLSVRFGPVSGAPFLKGVHVVRNGAPLPGSAADPVPGWAWIFIVACGLIPVITLGGAVPATIGVGGASAVISLARLRSWSVVMRAGACAAVTLACWLSLGLLLVAIGRTASPKAQESGFHVPFTKAISMSSSPEKLMEQIDTEYERRGYTEKAISGINENLRQNCGTLDKGQSIACLRTALLHAQSGDKD